MKWISVENGLPDISGKYVVKTITTGPLRRVNKFETRFHISENKSSWDVSNQIVTEWLNEKEE